MKTKKVRTRSRYKIIALLAVPILLLAGVGYALYSRNNDASKEQQVAEEQAEDEDNIDYSPPTEKDLEKNNRHKEELAENNEQTSENEGSKKSVKPQITYADVYEGNVEVNSHVPGIFENSGTCKLILSKDGETIEKTKKAVPNVSEMSCGLIKISKSKFSVGNWNAVVEYSSAKAYGKSKSMVIEVR